MRKSCRFTCASSCSSTSRRRSAVHSSASAGSRRIAATPLNQIGKMSAVQSPVTRKRTGPSSTVDDGTERWTPVTDGGGVRGGVGACSRDAPSGAPATCATSSAIGTSSRGQPAKRQLGSRADASGRARTPPHASDQTRWRSAAGARRRHSVTIAASTSSTVALTKASARIAIMSAALLPCVCDQLAQPLELRVREPCRRKIEQRRDGLLGGTIEERVKELAQRRLERALAWHRGKKHVAWPVLLMPQMPLVLEYTQQRAHRGVAWRFRELIEHLGGSRAAGAVDHVHDFSFTTAQLRVRFFGHRGALSGCMLKN